MSNLVSGVAAMAVLAGVALTWTSQQAVMEARRDLTAELSAGLGRARTLDAVEHRLEFEADAGREGAARLGDAIALAATPGERERLERGLALVLDGGVVEALVQVREARAVATAPVEQRWAAVDGAEATRRRRTPVGLGLVLLGLVGLVWLVVRPPRGDAAPAAPPLPADGSPELEALLASRLESLYQANARLDEATRFSAFGELAAALSHGLKTPVAGLLASVQLAQLKLGEANPARGELAEVVRLTSELSEQLQRFLRAAGQAAARPLRLEVSALLESLASSMPDEAQRRGLRLEVRALSQRLVVEADPALLEMALRNLVENALAATPAGGLIALGARLHEPPARVGFDGKPPPPGARFVALLVEDEGPGLPSEARRGEVGVTTRAHGSGLGLAIARRVAERHQGALLLEDRPGGGAAVGLVLPLVEVAR